MQRRLTQRARRGAIGGTVVTAAASAIAFNGGTVKHGIIMTIACVVAVCVAVGLVQLVTRSSGS